ncbi:MAG: DUF3084 domain-containing protein [Armatimonadota bacterium]
MTWRTILVLGIFIAVSGFIAYFGDLLGRRMGKRRLTLFGLRPRYTAIVITSFTGMLIAIFAIGIMALVSQRVRLLMIQGDNIVSRINLITRQYNDAHTLYQRAVQNLNKQRLITTKAELETKSAIQQRELLAAEIQQIRANLLHLKKDLKLNQEALRKAENQLNGTRKDLAAANREIMTRRQEISRQNSEIEYLEEKQKGIQEWLDLASPRLKALRESRVIFRPGEEIARRVIQCDQPISGIRTDMMRLLDSADTRARMKGAKPGINGSAIQILPKSIINSAGNNVFLKDEQTINALVDNIHAAKGSVVVLVISVGNSVDGEPALVDFDNPYQNLLIFNTNETVASTVIDGSQSKGEILSNLIQFLREKLRLTAIDNGVIPQLDENGQPTIGQIDDWDEIFDLIDKIKSIGKPVRVNAVASEETWSAGPLLLDFNVDDSQ